MRLEIRCIALFSFNPFESDRCAFSSRTWWWKCKALSHTLSLRSKRSKKPRSASALDSCSSNWVKSSKLDFCCIIHNIHFITVAIFFVADLKIYLRFWASNASLPKELTHCYKKGKKHTLNDGFLWEPNNHQFVRLPFCGISRYALC